MRLRYRFQIEGIMPERALLRLRRGGISLYNLQKTQKNVILFEVTKKDVEKVFAIYPNVCYNSSTYTPYKVRLLGGVGITKGLDFCKKRVGFVLGALAFAAITLAADGLVLGVDVVGITAYERDSRIALAENGIAPFAFYPKGKEDMVTAKLLTLDGVEFCSVKKVGNRVRVELQGSPLTTTRLQKESMTARESGTLLSLTVLRGTPLKQVGEEVQRGEALVGNWFCTETGEKVGAEPIARARIACTYERTYPSADEEQAFAQGYLDAALTATDEILEWTVTQREEGFHVKISYLLLQSVNM